jgi:hypothetical protein
LSGGSTRHVGGGRGAAVKPWKWGRDGRQPLHTMYVGLDIEWDLKATQPWYYTITAVQRMVTTKNYLVAFEKSAAGASFSPFDSRTISVFSAVNSL